MILATVSAVAPSAQTCLRETRVRVLPEDRAQAQQFCAAFAKVKPMPVSPGATNDWHLAGKLAEIVAARVLGVACDLDVRLGRDSGADLTTPDGRSLSVRAVQVKTRLSFDYRVIVRPHEQLADRITLALVAPDQGYVVFAGVVETGQFFSLATVERSWARIDTRWAERDEPWVITRSMLTQSFAELLPPTGRYRAATWVTSVE